MKYDRMKLRHMLFDSDSKYKKDAKYRDDESDIDDDFIELWEDECKKRDIEKAEKKFAKDNEKREADGEKPLKPADLKETLDGIDDKYKKLKKERGTRKAAQTGNTKSDEKLKEMIDKLDERIRTFKLQMVDKEEGKEIALGTRLALFLTLL
jgi:DNA topoisomerase-1